MVMRTVGEAGLSEWRDDHGRLLPHYAGIASALEQLGPEVLAERWQASRRQAERDAFTFYLDPREYRTTPLDMLPRVIPAEHWAQISAGVAQRLRAINRFVGELYGDGQDVVPNDVVYSCDYYLPRSKGFARRAMSGCTSTGSTWCIWAMAAIRFWRTTCAFRPGWRTR